MASLFRRSDHESCHFTSVVTANVDHVVGCSIFIVFQVSSLGLKVVNLLLVPFSRSVGRLFRRCLSVHRVALQHQPMFHPVTFSVSFVQCVSANTCTFGSAAKSQFCIEVASNNRYVFLQFVVCLSIVLYICQRVGPHVPSGGSTHS